MNNSAFLNYVIRTKKSEKAIFKHPEALMYFCKDMKILKKYEELISTNATCSYEYALIINKRFELGEKTISKSAYYSYLYAHNIVRGRFELGEEAISKDAQYAAHYANEKLRNRFILGEKTILTNGYYAIYYAHNVIKGRWPELEELIINDKYGEYLTINNVINYWKLMDGRWIEVEDRILNSLYKYEYITRLIEKSKLISRLNLLTEFIGNFTGGQTNV